MCDTHYFNYDPSLFDARVEMQDMLLMGNTAGNLPIHFAALSGSTEVIEYIGDMCLEALVKRNSNDLTALELAEDKDKVRRRASASERRSARSGGGGGDRAERASGAERAPARPLSHTHPHALTRTRAQNATRRPRR